MTSPELVDRAVALSEQMPILSNELLFKFDTGLLPQKESRALLIAAQELCAIATSLDQFASGVGQPRVGP